jgi:transcriptional regulator with XRE-family HTH domain
VTVSVAELCQQHKLTVLELSERSGLDPNIAMAIALGRWTPSPTERQKIAAVFEVTVEEVTWGHVTPIQHIYGQGPA